MTSTTPTRHRRIAPHRYGPRRRTVVRAVDERLGLDAIRYPVPEHANNLAWSLGGLTAVTLSLLVVTGVLLAQFYNPLPEAANASVRALVEEVPLGRFPRGLHFWSAQAMYVLVALHLLRVLLHASYKRPREANYLVGVTMFVLTIGAIYTGTVLKWDQEGYEALGHNVEIAQLFGGLGFWFSPEFAEGVPLLPRLYVAHVTMIPGLIVLLLVLHALLVKRHGISAHPALEKVAPAQVPSARTAPEGATSAVAGVVERTEPFTHHLRRVGAFGLVLLGVLSVLAVAFPPSVGPTPVQGIEVTKPWWIFWWLFTLENWLGLEGIAIGGGVFIGLLVLVPFVDRGPRRYWRQRPVAMTALALALAVMAALTVLMAVTPQVEHL